LAQGTLSGADGQVTRESDQLKMGSGRFFQKGSGLTMVGGYDFINAETGGGHTWNSGDIFLDLDGDGRKDTALTPRFTGFIEFNQVYEAGIGERLLLINFEIIDCC
jgi:hypothetical protein